MDFGLSEESRDSVIAASSIFRQRRTRSNVDSTGTIATIIARINRKLESSSSLRFQVQEYLEGVRLPSSDSILRKRAKAVSLLDSGSSTARSPVLAAYSSNRSGGNAGFRLPRLNKGMLLACR